MEYEKTQQNGRYQIVYRLHGTTEWTLDIRIHSDDITLHKNEGIHRLNIEYSQCTPTLYRYVQYQYGKI